jgi:hypothetical protein
MIMPSQERVDLRWVTEPLPDFRPRKQDEPRREYIRLLGEFKLAAATKQKQDYEAQQALDPAPQMPR